MNVNLIAEKVKSADVKTWTIVVLVALLILSSIVAWYRGQSKPTGSKIEYVKVPQIREVTKIKRVEIPVEKVVVLEKEAAAKKLDLPPEIRDDPDRQIAATAIIAPYEGRTNVLAVLDVASGGMSIMAKQVALPLIDFENRKEIGLRYGSSMKHSLEGDLYGHWDFFRIARAHLGVYGEINTNGDAKAMVQAAYKW